MGFSVVQVTLFGWKIKSKQAIEFINNNKNIIIKNQYTLYYHKFKNSGKDPKDSEDSDKDSGDYYIIDVHDDKSTYYLSLIRPVQEITGGRGYERDSDSESDEIYYESKDFSITTQCIN